MAPADLEGEAAVAFGQARAGEDIEAVDRLQRELLAGGAATGALATVAPGLKVAFADTGATDVLIVLFQRGAADWLQMLAPAGDPNYIAARPTIRVPTTGNNPGIGLASLNGTDFYLSASAPELKALYDQGSLAFVHATGLTTVDRSHFTVQDMMERGFADADPRQNSGWLARHMASLGGKQPVLSTVASASSVPTSLLSDSGALAIANVSNFNVTGGDANAALLRQMNPGTSAYNKLAIETLNAITNVQSALKTVDNSTAATAGYTGGALSSSLRSVAQLIKMNAGLTVATVDFGSWDMHNSLVSEFATRTTEFSRAINAFWNDIAAYRNNVTLVTMTEFGRRLTENSSQGTDHGTASGMLVLGGNVNGGKLYGSWPGLAAKQLYAGDLLVTTDYRQVVSEILVTRHSEANLSRVRRRLAAAGTRWKAARGSNPFIHVTGRGFALAATAAG